MMLKQLPVLLFVAQLWMEMHLNVAALIAANPLRGYHGAPIIDPFDSVIIGVNEDKVIECKGKRPVTWVFEKYNEFPDKVKITHFLHDSKDDDSILFTDELNLYRSNLELSGVTVDFVGEHYCVFNESLHEDQSDFNYEREVIDYEASSIYVFVNDTENPLYEAPHLIIGRQYEPFVIPCKPTSPQVKVELIKEDGETHYIGRFDPKHGFTVSFSDIESSGFFECRLVDDHDVFSQFHVIVNEQPLSAYIKKPIVTSETDFYARDGDLLQITCHVEVDSDVPYTVYFTLPSGTVVNASNDFVQLSQLRHEHEDRRKSHINLTIDNALASRDNGDYLCTIKDMHENSNSAIATITFVNEPIVHFDVLARNISANPNKKRIQFMIHHMTYPKATFEIYNNHNELIARGNDVINRDKYDVIITRDELKLVIKAPKIEDYGEFTVVATSDGKNYTEKLYLFVSEQPKCTMEDVYVEAGQEINMRCECLAYPLADMSWSFQECSNLSTWPECGRQRSDGEENQAESETKSDTAQTLPIRFTPTRPGTVTCRATNKHGTTRIQARAKIGDLSEPFMITGLNDNHQIASGDLVELECGAIIYNYSNSIHWTKDGNTLESEEGMEVVDTNTEYSWRKKLIFNEIKDEHSGEYNCEVNDLNTGEVKTLSTSIRVHEAVPPSITTNFNQSQITRNFGESLILRCYISGLPVPKLSWRKNSEPFEIEENERVTLTEENTTLAFSVLTVDDNGEYECIAENRIATERRSVEVDVTAPMKPVNKAIIISVVTIILVLVLLLIYLCLKVRIKKRQIAMLKAAGLANFEEGQIESIDPEINIDEQADLLPYDKKFEFPREKLKLGKQLGAGAFGVVVKATAQGILHYEEESTVAVKMVKKQTDNEVMKALVSELKIMIHLGQHLNVVNLLGAVTKNIAKRELMVIVEYCRFGNLQSFLVKHRPYFIDQVRNDQIDPMIMKNEMRWSKNSAYNSFNSEANQYSPPQNLAVSNPNAHMNTQGYVRHSGFHQVDSCNTEATVVSNMETVTGEEQTLLTNNSEQPLWRSNYTADYKGPARNVCTSDLVCWAFQVARGMDYLATRKVLHGDLAARNILLCDDNIVKICDFGLARSMYKNDNYKKKGEAPLPFKWLSIEAISDHVFSTYSDVWAFGVVLWELFTLGKVPYTGMEANQELFYKLRDGYRMEKPKYATQDLYDIMLNCWNAKPESRPLFNQLERKLSSFMMDSVKDHYLDLNEPYLQSNTRHYESGIRDYLTQLSIPNDEAPLPPLAEPEMFSIDNSTNNVPSTPDYLSMSPKSGVVKYNLQKADYLRPDSPTIAKNLDTSPKNKKNVNKKPELPEEIPMLAQNRQNGLPINDSDEEPVNTYTDMNFRRNSSGKKKRQAPQPPVVASTNSNSDPEYKNIFASSENYVNVPAIDKNKAVANPAYITFQSVNERA